MRVGEVAIRREADGGNLVPLKRAVEGQTRHCSAMLRVEHTPRIVHRAAMVQTRVGEGARHANNLQRI